MRKILSSLLIISGIAIAFMASAFYLLNKNEPLIGFDHLFKAITPQAPQHLSATFLGTSTILFSDGSDAIMIDGFFTRPDIQTLFWGRIEPDVALIKESLQRLNVKKLNAVVVVHSHHDHAMDAPTVARMTNAIVFGSESTANIARSEGLPDTQIEVVNDSRSLQFGAFNVTMIKSKHTPVPKIMAWLTGIGHNITKSFPSDPSLADYKEGGSYVVYIEHPLGNVLVQASGGYVQDLLKPYSADVIFLGIAGLSKQSASYKSEYYKETIDAVNAKRIIPIHWDNFMKPIGKELTPLPSIADDIPETIIGLTNRIKKDKNKSLIMMQAWDSLEIY